MFNCKGGNGEMSVYFVTMATVGPDACRPGLDRLRDHVAQAHFDRVLMTAPDRLARKYVHQMLLIEELEKGGCLVEFVERPMS
jgi:site-specific DNA recombinase